jgi:uncharacterized protein (TIGR02001 family)
MTPRVRFLLAGTVILIVLKLFVFRAQAQTVNEAPGPAKIYGEVALKTDSIEHGLTQTEKSFALQTGVGYRWPTFKLGLWGSNVKYEGGDESLNLRLYLAPRIVFTGNVDMTIRYDFNQYYKSGDRNGGIVSVDLRIYDYHILYEQNDNWEGTEEAGGRYGFAKTWNTPWGFLLNLNAGYNTLQVDGLSNYFDVKTEIGAKWADITYALGNSYNSNSSQFNGRGDIAFYLSASAQF